MASTNDRGMTPKTDSPSQTSPQLALRFPLERPTQSTISRVHKLCLALPKLDCEESALRFRHACPQIEVFEPFPRLARELRNQIWQYAAFFPREVRLRTVDMREHYSQAEHWRAPAILHANREAREEGLRYYELVYEKTEHRLYNMYWRYNPNGPPARINGLLRGAYINFEVDRFVHPTIDWSTVQERLDYQLHAYNFAVADDYNFERDVMKKIQYLEFPHAGLGSFVLPKMEKTFGPLAKSVLKTVTLLLHEKFYFYPNTSFDECLELRQPGLICYQGFCRRMKIWGFVDKQLNVKWIEDMERFL